MVDAMTRARKYLEKIPGAVSGSGGHDQTFKTLASLWYNFGNEITEDHFRILANDYNQRCQPAWSQKELEHKISDVLKNVKPKPAPNNSTRAYNPPATIQAATPNIKETPKNKNFWKTQEEALAAYNNLPIARDDPEVLEFLKRDYGLDEEFIPYTWRVMDYYGERGIVYAGYDPARKSLVFRWKSIARDANGKRKCRFLWGKGGIAFYDNPEKPDAPLVIVGGEEKAAAAYMAGYRALTLLTGEHKPDDDIIKYILDNKPSSIILANDNDETGAKANKQTAAALVEAGFPAENIKIVQWHDEAPNGYDLNDVLKENGIEGLQKFPDSAAPYNSNDPSDDDNHYDPFDKDNLSLLTPTQILSLPLREDDNILGDRLISRGNLFVILGEGGIGKSRLLLDLSFALILGRNWLMFVTLCKGLKIIIFQDENSARRLRDDLRRIPLTEEERREVDRCLRILTPLKEHDRDIAFYNPEAIRRMKEAVQAFKPDIVAFDPLIDFFGGEDENNNNDMRLFCQQAREIAAAGNPDAAIIICHHSRTGRIAMKGASGYDRAAFGRGAKSLYNKSRSALNIVRGSETDENILVCIPAKCNDGKLPDRFAVQFDEHEGIYKPIIDFDWESWEESLEPSKSGGRTQKAKTNDVVAALAGERGLTNTELVEKIIKDAGCSESTAQRRITDAVKEGKVVHTGNLYKLKS